MTGDRFPAGEQHLPLLARARIVEALAGDGTGVRLVRAPLGAGKSVALRAYAAARGARYVRCSVDESLPEFALRCGPKAGELVIDDVDRAIPAVQAALAARLEAMGSGACGVFGSRGPLDLRLDRAFREARFRTIDADFLAFDASEAAALATRHGVAFTAQDVCDLLRETDGWPLAVAAIVADVASDGRPLAQAVSCYLAGEGRVLGRAIVATVREAGDAPRAAFDAVARAPGRAAYELLVPLATRGLFVRETSLGPRPYRLAFALATAPETRPLHAPASGMHVRLLGRCETTVDGRPVEWIRRRDAHLFAYVLLRPGGRATRAELRDVFWPGGGAQAANQSIRTACSNIRRALANAVGRERAASYFSSREDVAVGTGEIALDVHAFLQAADAGDRAHEEARWSEARNAYRTALDWYEGPLLGSEAPELWARATALRCRERQADVSQALSLLNATEGERTAVASG